MKAELNIDTAELEERIAKRLIMALKPLLKVQAEDTALFTVKSLSSYLQVSEKWVYERVQFKEIPYYKVGSNLRFKKSVVERWLEENCKTPVASQLSGPLTVAK